MYRGNPQHKINDSYIGFRNDWLPKLEELTGGNDTTEHQHNAHNVTYKVTTGSLAYTVDYPNGVDYEPNHDYTLAFIGDNPVTITLPSSQGGGRVLQVKNMNTIGNVYVDVKTPATEDIDGVDEITISPGEGIIIVDVAFYHWSVLKNLSLPLTGGTITGQIVLSGSGLVWMRERPQLDQTTITGLGKPTLVYRGLLKGFSLPIYSSDNEELFFSEPHVPGRWDGASDIHVMIQGYLDTANNAKRFKLQCSWEHFTGGTDVAPTTSHDTSVETLTGNWAQYQSFEFDFTLDYDIDTPDNVISGDTLGLRIRRIAKTGAEAEITGEVVITGIDMHYQCNKFGSTSS